MYTVELYGEIHFDSESFQIMSVVHPSTYLNKLLLGSKQGQLQLWNIRTNKLIYTFAGWGSPILCLSQSPAIDVVGMGLENGTVVIHNLKFDESLMKFHQEWGPVTALSFRTGEALLEKYGSMSFRQAMKFEKVTELYHFYYILLDSCGLKTRYLCIICTNVHKKIILPYSLSIHYQMVSTLWHQPVLSVTSPCGTLTGAD